MTSAPKGEMGLRIGGLVPLSTIDHPGRLAAVVFCQGCTWRCRYCQNPSLLPKQPLREVPWRRVEDLLGRRRGLLETVVFSGGEPTLQRDLPEAVRRVGRLGFRVGLHTAGVVPERLAHALDGGLNWVGLDVKAPWDRYPEITGDRSGGSRVAASLDLVLAAADEGRVDYEVRTTYHPALLSEEDLCRLASDLTARGVRRFALQRFRPQGCVDHALRGHGAAEVSPSVLYTLSSHFEHFEFR